MLVFLGWLFFQVALLDQFIQVPGPYLVSCPGREDVEDKPFIGDFVLLLHLLRLGQVDIQFSIIFLPYEVSSRDLFAMASHPWLYLLEIFLVLHHILSGVFPVFFVVFCNHNINIQQLSALDLNILTIFTHYLKYIIRLLSIMIIVVIYHHGIAAYN